MYRKLLHLAAPIVLARATQSVVGFTDAVMVSPLGEAALAAVTTGSLNTTAFTVLPVGTVFILQSFVAQLRGRGDLGSVRRYAHYGLVLSLAVGVLAILSIPLVPLVLERLQYTPEVSAAMTTYMTIRLLAVGFTVGSEALGSWYGGLGNTRVAMIVGLTTMVTNVFLNYLLIEPRFGLPGYGVAGSAWASSVAGALGFAVAAAMFFGGHALDPAIRASARGSFRVRELLRVLRFGVPNGINWFLELSAYLLFFNAVVARLGMTVLAALNVVMQINSISFMPTFGLASAGAILVGESIGRRAHDEVPPIVRRTGLAACAWMLTMAAVYVAFPSRLMNIFRSDDVDAQHLVAIGTTMLMLSAIWQLFDAIGMTLGEALRAAGDTTWTMWARIILAWVVFTPGAYAGVVLLNGGVVTVMIALIVYIASIALLLALRFRSGRWRTIDLVQAEPQLV